MEDWTRRLGDGRKTMEISLPTKARKRNDAHVTDSSHGRDLHCAQALLLERRGADATWEHPDVRMASDCGCRSYRRTQPQGYSCTTSTTEAAAQDIPCPVKVNSTQPSFGMCCRFPLFLGMRTNAAMHSLSLPCFCNPSAIGHCPGCAVLPCCTSILAKSILPSCYCAREASSRKSNSTELLS